MSNSYKRPEHMCSCFFSSSPQWRCHISSSNCLLQGLQPFFVVPTDSTILIFPKYYSPLNFNCVKTFFPTLFLSFLFSSQLDSHPSASSFPRLFLFTLNSWLLLSLFFSPYSLFPFSASSYLSLLPLLCPCSCELPQK